MQFSRRNQRHTVINICTGNKTLEREKTTKHLKKRTKQSIREHEMNKGKWQQTTNWVKKQRRVALL